jgi:two-component system, LytTR family, response regulator LytT
MRLLIVEDETAAVRNLISMLHSVEPRAVVTGVTDSVSGTVGWLEANAAPDLILMDIHLADGDAFAIFERIKVITPVIFTTAYDKYALEAFHLSSIDYLLKPVRADELKRALDKFRSLTRIESDTWINNTNRSLHHISVLRNFLIPVKDKILPLSPEEIAFCHTAGEKVSAYTFDGRSYPLDKSLDILSSMLPGEDFFRANRQFIISRTAISDLTIWYGSRLSVNLKLPVPEKIIISKNRVPLLKRWLSGHT